MVEKVVGLVRQEQIRGWALRLLMPAVAMGLFVLLSTAFNVWADLTAYNLVRRSVAGIATAAWLFGPAVFLRWRYQAWYLAAVWVVLGLLYITNLVYTTYAGGFLSASTLSYITQVSDTGGSIRTLLGVEAALFMLPALVFLLVGISSFKYRPHVPGVSRVAALVLIAGVIGLTGAGYGYVAYKELQQYGDVTRITSHPFDSSELIRKVGIINYNIIDAVNYARRKKALTSAEADFVRDRAKNVLTPQTSNEATGKLKGQNVVFVQLESFQQFLIGAKVNGQEITPNLNTLAASARQYTNFHYVIGPGTSSDAEFVAFTSLMNLANAAVVYDYPAGAYRAFPAELKKRGYRTVAYHADSRNFWNRSNTYPGFGFDEYVAEESYKPGEVIGYGLDDHDFFDQTLEHLATLPQPFYAHAITLTSHSPFELPKKHQVLDVSGIKLTKLQQDYLQSAHYTDKALGRFMERLRASKLAGSTSVVVMGDHEGFTFTGKDRDFAAFLGHADGFTDASLAQARQVPFLIYTPDGSLAGTDERPASQIDVYPTLVNLLGVEPPAGLLGVDLMGTTEPTVIQRSRGVGPSLSYVERGNRFYSTAGVGGGPVCVQDGVLVAENVCRDLVNYATNKVTISDLVIQGNRVDLLRNRR